MESPERLSLQSADGVQLNLDALYQIAPSCFTEAADPKTGKIKRMVNFYTLRQLLGDDAVEDAPEAYEFNWVGKQAARAEVLRPINKTLRPVKEDSVDWDTTQNLYIEGDNLEVLKLLQKSYLGKVKMIYIDPPYNTGNDFVYHDDFARSQAEEDLFAGNVDELGNRFIKNTDSNGRYHSDWCSMIYSRLMIARSLLSEDGVIFISIDDNEIENLKKICDEVFGNFNFLAEFPRVTKKGGKYTDLFAKNHDYILAFGKNIGCVKIKGLAHIDEGFRYQDEFVLERGKYKLNQTLDYNTLGYINSLDYPITIDGKTYYAGDVTKEEYEERKKINPKDGFRWRWSKDLFEFGLKNGWIVVGNSGRIYTKTYLNARIEKMASGYCIKYEKRTKPITTLDFTENAYSNDNSNKEITNLLGKSMFDYVKPTSLVNLLLKATSGIDSIILDFFSGSATTAHAVMQLNSEDGGNRKFIMVQLPELTDEDSEAYKAGYKNICEIGKERIRRAGKKIKEESPLTTQDLDTGFRVFRVDSSNYEEVEHTPKEWNQDQLDLFLNNIKSDRTDLDLLFGCMLDWGVQLSLPMTTEEVDGKMIYTVNEGDLVACFADKVTDNVVRAMAEKQPLRVIFRDSCFDRDADKINIYETFKQLLDWSDQEVVKNIRVI